MQLTIECAGFDPTTIHNVSQHLCRTTPAQLIGKTRDRFHSTCYIFAIGNVGDRAQSCCQRRPCEIAGWLIVDAASSTSVALLQLLVVDVVVVCNLL